MGSLSIRGISLALGLALWFGSQPASAQDANRDALAASEARDIVERVARRSGEFREEFGRAVQNSMINGGKAEDRAKRRSQELDDSARKMRDVFNDKTDKANPAVRRLVDRTLTAGADINRVMLGNRFTEKVRRDWDALRSDLNALAQIYSLPPF